MLLRLTPADSGEPGAVTGMASSCQRARKSSSGPPCRPPSDRVALDGDDAIDHLEVDVAILQDRIFVDRSVQRRPDPAIEVVCGVVVEAPGRSVR
jgi:hypothetical protein